MAAIKKTGYFDLKFMCIYLDHMCINVLDITFLWSNLWLGELSTDDNNDDDNAEANTNTRWQHTDEQFMIT